MEEEISLSELFNILKRHVGKIIIWCLTGLAIAGVYTFFFVIPQYQSTTKIVVNQTQNTGQAITNTDIQTNLNLINTYQSIIQEPIILEDVIYAVDSNLTMNELRNKISVQTESNSLVFGVTVTDDNPYEAAKLANAVADSFEKKIGDIMEVESVTILSQAVPNNNAVSPNAILNLVLGLIVGMMIGVGLSLLNEMLNKSVKDDKFIEALGWVNLGSVLEMSIDEVKNTRIKTQRPSRNLEGRVSRRRV